MRLAIASGMTRAEVSACEANFRALLSIAAPLLYSRVYTLAVSSPGVLQGSPYFLCLSLLAVSHLVFCSLSKEDLGSQ